jgi:hypothetical protein
LDLKIKGTLKIKEETPQEERKKGRGKGTKGAGRRKYGTKGRGEGRRNKRKGRRNEECAP